MNTVIVLTILGALVLLWGGILALIKWIVKDGIEHKHLYGLGAYISVICGIFIYLVIHTSITQQEAALTETKTRLRQELEHFRNQLGDLTDKLMGQIAEKAELTQSEMEVRGNLQTERAEHKRTREDLAQSQTQWQQTQAELIREADAHRAYLDSLNTERALHRSARERLQEEQQRHSGTQRELQSTRDELSTARERLGAQKAELDRLRKDIELAEARTKQAQENEHQLQQKIAAQQKALGTQQKALDLLQASVDSIYQKVLKRPRIPATE